MSQTVKIMKSELLDIITKIQQFHALKTVKNIIVEHPERIKEFGFKNEDFVNLDNELKIADDACHTWWITIARKYNLPEKSSFRIQYNDGTITVC